MELKQPSQNLRTNNQPSKVFANADIVKTPSCTMLFLQLINNGCECK
jgi:hypothetical protein